MLRLRVKDVDMDSLINRLKASLALTPAFLLLLVWIGRFAGAIEVVEMGLMPFLLWAAAVSFAMSWCVTLFVSLIPVRSEVK